VNYRSTPWYVSYQHLDSSGHDCGVCNPSALPSRVVSVETVQTTTREILVNRLAAWLSHLHQPSRVSGAAA
jgi:hypothetical protein